MPITSTNEAIASGVRNMKNSNLKSDSRVCGLEIEFVPVSLTTWRFVAQEIYDVLRKNHVDIIEWGIDAYRPDGTELAQLDLYDNVVERNRDRK